MLTFDWGPNIISAVLYQEKYDILYNILYQPPLLFPEPIETDLLE